MTGASYKQLSPRALQLLRDAVASATITHVARELKISRPAVSLLLKGTYKGNADAMEGRILGRFGAGYVACPHLGSPIAVAECQSWRKRPMPTSNPDALRHWAACQKCPIGAGIAKMVRQGWKPTEPLPAQPAPAALDAKPGGDAS